MYCKYECSMAHKSLILDTIIHLKDKGTQKNNT